MNILLSPLNWAQWHTISQILISVCLSIALPSPFIFPPLLFFLSLAHSLSHTVTYIYALSLSLCTFLASSYTPNCTTITLIKHIFFCNGFISSVSCLCLYVLSHHFKGAQGLFIAYADDWAKLAAPEDTIDSLSFIRAHWQVWKYASADKP